MTRLLPDAAFIAAMQEGLPQITDPMDAQEAENGVCASDDRIGYEILASVEADLKGAHDDDRR